MRGRPFRSAAERLRLRRRR